MGKNIEYYAIQPSGEYKKGSFKNKDSYHKLLKKRYTQVVYDKNSKILTFFIGKVDEEIKLNIARFIYSALLKNIIPSKGLKVIVTTDLDKSPQGFKTPLSVNSEIHKSRYIENLVKTDKNRDDITQNEREAVEKILRLFESEESEELKNYLKENKIEMDLGGGFF